VTWQMLATTAKMAEQFAAGQFACLIEKSSLICWSTFARFRAVPQGKRYAMVNHAVRWVTAHGVDDRL